MKGNVFDKIRKASIKYQEYMLDCYDITKEAQKHIYIGTMNRIAIMNKP